MKTSELTGQALDWAVAKCEGTVWDASEFLKYRDLYDHDDAALWYSIHWAQGGPIIEREGLDLRMEAPGEWHAFMWWDDTNGAGDILMKGPTPLIAAMRCYVHSKLGDEVDVPELLQGESK
jgi:hypothetical protein